MNINDCMVASEMRGDRVPVVFRMPTYGGVCNADGDANVNESVR